MPTVNSAINSDLNPTKYQGCIDRQLPQKPVERPIMATSSLTATLNSDQTAAMTTQREKQQNLSCDKTDNHA